MCSHVGLAMRGIALALASLAPAGESCRTRLSGEHLQGYSLQERQSSRKVLTSRSAEIGDSLSALALLLLRPAGPVAAWGAVRHGGSFAVKDEHSAGHAGSTRRSVLAVSAGMLAAIGLQAPALAEDLTPAAQAFFEKLSEAPEQPLRRPPLVSDSGPAPDLNFTRSLDDEFTLEFDNTKPLGLNLRDLRVGSQAGVALTSRVIISEVIPGSQAAATGKLRNDIIVVAVDGASVEKETAKSVTDRIGRIKKEGRPVKLTFKDPEEFNDRLSMLPSNKEEAMAPVSTKIAPGSETEKEQVISVKRLEIPEDCKRNAKNGDVVEIRYTGRLEDGFVFDGMEQLKRLGDDSLQFVLGRQPAGQFPPSWDVGMNGMCVGERRLIDVPPVLGFGPKGVPKRNVPPNARLFYDIELVSLNGLATP